LKYKRRKMMKEGKTKESQKVISDNPNSPFLYYFLLSFFPSKEKERGNIIIIGL